MSQNELPKSQNELPKSQNELPMSQNELPKSQHELPMSQNELPMSRVCLSMNIFDKKGYWAIPVLKSIVSLINWAVLYDALVLCRFVQFLTLSSNYDWHNYNSR
ncbi:hypothetical protein FACS1894200_06670 [Spirochaetia bacterium]|nr:hypothetical protein FACS1894200_06670 [Spirochaetia bacterium]